MVTIHIVILIIPYSPPTTNFMVITKIVTKIKIIKLIRKINLLIFFIYFI